MLVSESEERQLGVQAYRQVLASEQLSRRREANALVEKVGRRIAAAAERPPANCGRRRAFAGNSDHRQERAQRLLPAGRQGRGLYRHPADHPHRGRARRRDRPRGGACAGPPQRRAA